MRPINLTIKGINSYASEQKVNFEKVSSLNLFGVFGETGSGKTTILDAIIMALYGTSERDVTQNIINVNLSDAYIIFEFEMVEGNKKVRYKVRRDYKLRPSGLKTDAILLNAKTNLVLAEKTDPVNEQILKIIRVAKKEFLKCIALPQGEFDNFLGDTPMNRKKTVAKLFNLEQFGQELNDKLKKRKELAMLEKLSLEEKILIYKDVSKENLEKFQKLLTVKQQEKLDLEFVHNKLKLDYNFQASELEKKERLADFELQLSIKNQERKEIEHLGMQVSYTKNYGDYLVVLNKYNASTSERERVEKLLKELKVKLSTFEKNLRESEKKQSSLLLEKEKLALRMLTLNKKMELKNKLQEDTFLKVSQLKEQSATAEKIKRTLEELENNLSSFRKNEEIKVINYNALGKELNRVIELTSRIENIKTLGIKEELLSFFNGINKPFKNHLFNDIENTKSYELINNLLTQINEYKNAISLDINLIRKDLKDLSEYGRHVDEIQTKIEAKNKLLNSEVDKIKDELQEIRKQIYQCEIEATNNKTLLLQTLNTIKSLQLGINENKNEMDNIPSQKVVDELQELFDNSIAELGKFEQQIQSEQKERNQVAIDIEVNASILESNKNKAQELKELLTLFNINGVDKATLTDQTLLLDENELKEAEETLKNYHSTLSFLENSITELKQKLTLKTISKESLEKSLERIDYMQTQLQEIGVEIGVLENDIKIQIKNIEVVSALREDLKKAKSKLETILDLQSLIANGALLEYVAEEYMYLITEFANKYVHLISKGKYFLKYNGDFNVIDNFNGGIQRGVKTLSGGERFIISLSLALGISQSIATNNNQNFNFFFIDEGFGSLSDGYIEKVLQSFDALIKLDFTVGFITHVERMQNYITNKIIVTKESNEQGSKITEVY